MNIINEKTHFVYILSIYIHKCIFICMYKRTYRRVDGFTARARSSDKEEKEEEGKNDAIRIGRDDLIIL